MPSVSILIPCYNAERWVAHCIQSALNQTYDDKEVIVVDDGSTDGSLDVIKSFGDQIRWETGPNRGGNAARNRLLEMSHGEWLQYLDADDYLLPGKIGTQIQLTIDNPDADVIFSPVLFEEWLNDDKPAPLQSSPLQEPLDPWILLARWKLPQTGGSLWRRRSIIDCGKWDESLPCCQEHDLYLRLLISGACFFHSASSEAVYRYWQGATVSRRNPAMVQKQRLNLLDRLYEAIRVNGDSLHARIRAVNMTRFEIARSLWPSNPVLALEIMRLVRNSDPAFTPSGPASPRLYGILYRMLGFSMTEHVAKWARRIPRRTPNNPP
jgi:glycosyltransferase involved in cell wall biosynthesis